MKKSDFIELLAEKIDQTKKDTTAIVDAFLAIIVEAVKKGDEVVFPELGKFVLKRKPARTARNPVTGATVDVPAKIVPAFKAAKKFKDAVAS